MPQYTESQLHEVLKNQFGFNAFRPGQLEAIMALLNHGELLCIQPTGHGKSLLYQLPATLLEGVVLVISPLIALMRDQLEQLKNRFHISAASINSDQGEEENQNVRRIVQEARVKILFVSPEQLDHIDRFQFLLSLPISLIVVDEAHCISTWGHDFRPSYRQIIHLVKALRDKSHDIKILGLTATANAKTEEDIKQQLSQEAKKIIVYRENMNRPNIQLSVVKAKSVGEKLLILEKIIQQLEGVGLIYCATQDNTELVAEYLKTKNIHAASYHAGYEAEIKQKLQRDFLNNQFKVIAATNALGMGIDKSDLRFIIHFDIPGSITAYYQEVGRCGRDGLPAKGILLYHFEDTKIQEHFIDSAQPSPKHFDHILKVIESASEPLKITSIKQLSGMHPTLVTVAITELVEQGFIKKISERGSQVYIRTEKTGSPNLQRYETQFVVRTQELSSMEHYAEQKEKCLMQILRNALGDSTQEKCNQCHVCNRQEFSEAIDKEQVMLINNWLSNKGCPIKASKIVKIEEGISMLDGKLRIPDFIYFMKQRAVTQSLGVSDDLKAMIEKHIRILCKKNQFGSVIVLPSRTWKARSLMARKIAEQLKVPVVDCLSWKTEPKARQGELLNNDQRRENVVNKMQCQLINQIPTGAILLLDDYTGSFATLQEAGRALRKEGKITQKIIPFTIASVKWRLGKRGMI